MTFFDSSLVSQFFWRFRGHESMCLPSNSLRIWLHSTSQQSRVFHWCWVWDGRIGQKCSGYKGLHDLPQLLCKRWHVSQPTIPTSDICSDSLLNVCDGSFVLNFLESESGDATVIHITRNAGDSQSISVVQAKLDAGVTAQFDLLNLCPATGRAVFLTGDWDLYVVDYLRRL